VQKYEDHVDTIDGKMANYQATKFFELTSLPIDQRVSAKLFK